MKRASIGWLLAGMSAAATVAAFAVYFKPPEERIPDDAVKPQLAAWTGSSNSAKKPAVASEKELTSPYYLHAIRGNMFGRPMPAASHTPPAKQSLAHAIVPHVPAIPDPLADAVYAGSVTRDGKTVALIQSRTKKTGKYIASGSHWNGFTVRSVSPKSIDLVRDGSKRTLERSDRINVVQLNASAPVPQKPATPAGPPVLQQLAGANNNGRQPIVLT